MTLVPILLIVLSVSFAACVGLALLVRRLALATGVVDRPNGRKIHMKPIPRLGGLAIYAAFWTPLLVAYLFTDFFSRGSSTVWSPRLTGFLLCSVGLLVLGVIDDIRGLSASSKLPVEVVLASVMYFAGFAIKAVNIPLIGGVDLGPLALPVTILWFVGMANAMNLLDGIDGAAAGISAIAAISLAVAMPWERTNPLLLTFCLIGASVGFLVHNFPPARIFMGDSGSLFLGFTLAAIATRVHHKSTAAVAMLVPISALAVPLADTAMAVTRRLWHRRPVFSADNGHVHHRLLAMGLSARRSVLVLYGMAGLCGLVAVGIARIGGSQALILVMLLGVSLALVLWKVKILRVPGSPPLQAGEEGGPVGVAAAAESKGGKTSTD